MLTTLVALALAGAVYGIYKHITVAQIKAEVSSLEAAAITDAKTIYASIKSHL